MTDTTVQYDIPLMIEEWETVAKSIRNAITNVKKMGQSKWTTATLKGRLQLLDKYRDRCTQLYLPLKLHADQEDLASIDMQALEQSYLEAFDFLNEKIAEVSSPSAGSSLAGTSGTPVSAASACKLARIDIPKFSGLYTEWSEFADLFDSLIIKNESLSAVQRLHYLKNSLTGEAHNLLKNTKIATANFDSAWNTLKKRYNNPRATIDAYLTLLFDIPTGKDDLVSGLKLLRDTATEVRDALTNLERPVSKWDDILVYLLVRKLGRGSRKEWETSLGDRTEYPSFADFTQFLDTRIRTLEALSSSTKGTECNKPRESRVNKTKPLTAHLTSSRIICLACKSNHRLYHCDKFKKMSISQREALVRQGQLCLNCLCKGHSNRDCKCQLSCFSCHQRHHTLLHRETTRNQQSGPLSGSVLSNTDSSESTSNTTSNVVSSHNVNVYTRVEDPSIDNSVLLSTAYVHILGPYGRSIRVRALLDPGSESSFISESVTQALRLNRTPLRASVSGVGGAPTNYVSHVVNCKIRPVNKIVPELPLRAWVLRTITAYNTPSQLSTAVYPHLHGLPLADQCSSPPGRIEVLLGADIYGAVLTQGLVQGPIGTPIAQNTIFGWVITGPAPNRLTSPTTIRVHHCSPSLDDTLRKFWETEELPFQPRPREDDSVCEQLFKTTHRRVEDGRYVVRLPFSQDPVLSLGQSYNVAVSSLLRLEKRLKPEESTQYAQFLAEYEGLGHMSIAESNSGPTSRVFLPHHPVMRPDSTTTRLRVVFNASCPTSNGNSLNDVLLSGPKLQAELPLIILQWRSFQFVYTADIKKMFRQIWIDPRDRHTQCIVWRKSPADPISPYTLNTVTYGTTCAPFLAMRVIRQLVLDEGEKYPLAVPILSDHVYVDDILFGADDKKLALQSRDQVIQLLNAGGFQLGKWSSNLPSLLDGIPREDCTPANDSLNLNSDSLKVLGIRWHPTEDAFKVSIKWELHKHPTKRTVLSVISRIFDPLGWLAPLVVGTKILLQHLWTRKSNWDDPLPPDLLNRWHAYCNEMSALTSIAIPRWTGEGIDNFVVELHGFSDASNSAYAAVVYLRVVTLSGNIKISLLMAKTKVAPLKTLSVPRLELSAAVLLTRLLDLILASKQFPNQRVFCWTDSTVTLGWIRKEPQQWKTFVANRVSEIQTRLPLAKWLHVPSDQNPADCASRGVSAKDFSKHPLWWNGPEWLLESEEQWPAQPVLSQSPVELESKGKVCAHTSQQEADWELSHKISSWPKLLRVTAYVLRFTGILLGREERSKPLVLTRENIEAASQFWIKRTQAEHFSKEISAIKNRCPLQKPSSFQRLHPYCDEFGIVRVGGRLRFSSLPYTRRHPILLPRSRISELLIKQYHELTLHGGTQLTLRTLRENYWILGARNLVKAHIHNCIPCTRFRASTNTQFMADLPYARSNPSRPFSHAGVDYAGPFSVLPKRGRGVRALKSYVALFVCLATRATHLELVLDYTSEAFLAALDRFVSRRGLPTDLYSDRGTNFQGANRELSKHFRALGYDTDTLAKLATDGMNWHFLPPSAPHFGGLWEAGVKSTKHHLKRVLGDHTPTVEEFQTLLCRVEACLNSRPIAPLNDDIDSYDALTPGHFLVGTSLKSVPSPSLLDLNESRLSRWQLVNLMTERFWHIWTHDYLNHLQQRAKWSTIQPNLAPGDLVLLKHANLPPTKWSLGRIVQVHPGSDSLVRVVTVRTAQSTFTRPITKVCKLPV